MDPSVPGNEHSRYARAYGMCRFYDVAIHGGCAGLSASPAGLLTATSSADLVTPVTREGVALRGLDASDRTWRAVVHPRHRLAEEQPEQPEWQLCGAGARTHRALPLATGRDGRGRGGDEVGASPGPIACGKWSGPAPSRRLAEAGRSRVPGNRVPSPRPAGSAGRTSSVRRQWRIPVVFRTTYSARQYRQVRS